MTLRKLFLCHYSGNADEVKALAGVLRLHGIVPWVDKEGGFLIGDDCEAEARRAISQECSGLLLYATEEVFRRPFIRDVEVAQAMATSRSDSSFALFAVPRGISFDKLSALSQEAFGCDLTRFHTVSILDQSAVTEAYNSISSMVLQRIIQESYVGSGRLSLQYSTRELMPHEPDDVLCIDARAPFLKTVANPDGWACILDSLRRVKSTISLVCGRPRLLLHGSKHLTGAFLFGRVFAPFEIDIRQTPQEVWRSDAEPRGRAPFCVSVSGLDSSSKRLSLEIATRHKNVERGVDEYLSRGEPQPTLRLRLTPEHGPLTLDDRTCRVAVAQVYDSLERILRSHVVEEIHLFAAVPQSFMMMLGRRFMGMPPVHLYEWNGSKYVQACRIPSGVL